MATDVEILFRDSSERDGVQSRGAGWRRADAPQGSPRQQLRTLASHLAKGDVVRIHGKGLLVHDGARLVPVKDTVYKLDMAARWEETEESVALFQLAYGVEIGRKWLVAAACDCAEAVLSQVPRGEGRPRATLLTVRRWLEGRATAEDVLEAEAEAYLAYAEVRYSPYARALEAAQHAATSVTSPWYAVDVAKEAASVVRDNRRVQRSLAFLVRARIPLWRLCLAGREARRETS